MTLEQFIAAWIVGTSVVSSAFAIVAVVFCMHTFMDDAEARERRRRGYRLDAVRSGVEAARPEDADRAEALRVYRETGWMWANNLRRYGR